MLVDKFRFSVINEYVNVILHKNEGGTALNRPSQLSWRAVFFFILFKGREAENEQRETVVCLSGRFYE